MIVTSMISACKDYKMRFWERISKGYPEVMKRSSNVSKMNRPAAEFRGAVKLALNVAGCKGG